MKSGNLSDAASGLTTLVHAVSMGGSIQGSISSSLSDEDEETERGEEVESSAATGSDFLIPQRFTKSGRKRATPFPIKVRLSEIVLEPKGSGPPQIHIGASARFGVAVHQQRHLSASALNIVCSAHEGSFKQRICRRNQLDT